MYRKKLRRAEKIEMRLEKEKQELADMGADERDKWLSHIKQRSEGSREVIKFWLARARLQMLDKRRGEIRQEKNLEEKP